MRNLYTTCSVILLLVMAPLFSQNPYRIETITGYTDLADTVPAVISRKHTGPVASLAAIPGTDSFFAAGKDGFVSRFSPEGF